MTFRKLLKAWSVCCLFLSCSISNTPVIPNIAGFYRGDLDGKLEGCEIRGLASNGKLIVAVTYEGVIAYSENARDWMPANTTDTHSNDTGIRFNAVCFGEGYFFAGGEGGGAAFSDDGKNWTTGVVMPMSPKDINAVSAGKVKNKSMFVAAGTDGRIAYSIGGPQNKWDEASLTPFGNVDNYGETIRGLGYGNVDGRGIFVAVGDDGKIAFANDLSGKWYGGRSGANWQLNAVAFGNDKFVVVGENGLVKYCEDPSTYSWTSADIKVFGSVSLFGVTFNPTNEFFTVFGDKGAVAYSDYAHTWQAMSFSVLPDILTSSSSPDLPSFDFENEEYLSAATAFKSQIILAGSRGTIVYSNGGE